MKPNKQCALTLATALAAALMTVPTAADANAAPHSLPLGTLTICNATRAFANGNAWGASYVRITLYMDGRAEWRKRDVKWGDCDGTGRHGGGWQDYFSITGYLDVYTLGIRIKREGDPGVHMGSGAIELDPTDAGFFYDAFSPSRDGGLRLQWSGATTDYWAEGGNTPSSSYVYKISKNNYSGPY